MSLTVDDVKADVIAFCREYPAAASLAYKIRDTQQELFGDQATVERYGILAAAYFPRSRRVDIAASALRDHEEVARTLRHEILGHYALNTFQPAHKCAILDAIAATRGDPAFAQTWSDVDTNYPGRSEIGKAEEVYCAFAEYAAAGRASSNGQTTLQQTCFLKQRPLTDHDLAAIVDHVADGLHRNTRRQQTFPATDADQFRLAERTNGIKASTYDERVADHREAMRSRRCRGAAESVPLPEMHLSPHQRPRRSLAFVSAWGREPSQREISLTLDDVKDRKSCALRPAEARTARYVRCGLVRQQEPEMTTI